MVVTAKIAKQIDSAVSSMERIVKTRGMGKRSGLIADLIADPQQALIDQGMPREVFDGADKELKRQYLEMVVSSTEDMKAPNSSSKQKRMLHPGRCWLCTIGIGALILVAGVTALALTGPAAGAAISEVIALAITEGEVGYLGATETAGAVAEGLTNYLYSNKVKAVFSLFGLSGIAALICQYFPNTCGSSKLSWKILLPDVVKNDRVKVKVASIWGTGNNGKDGWGYGSAIEAELTPELSVDGVTLTLMSEIESTGALPDFSALIRYQTISSGLEPVTTNRVYAGPIIPVPD